MHCSRDVCCIWSFGSNVAVAASNSDSGDHVFTGLILCMVWAIAFGWSLASAYYYPSFELSFPAFSIIVWGTSVLVIYCYIINQNSVAWNHSCLPSWPDWMVWDGLIHQLQVGKTFTWGTMILLLVSLGSLAWACWCHVLRVLLLLLSRFSRVRLYDPIDGNPPGSSAPGVLQARVLEWVAISFSNAYVHAKLLQSCLTLFDPMDSRPPGSSVHRIL